MAYQCKSCVYCQASVSLLSRKIIEKHWEDFIEILDKKNISRKECLLLPLRTIAKA